MTLFSHDLDEHWVNSVALAFVVDVDVIQTIEGVLKFCIFMDWCINGGALLPPQVRALTVIADYAIWVIVETYPIPNEASIHFFTISPPFFVNFITF